MQLKTIKRVRKSILKLVEGANFKFAIHLSCRLPGPTSQFFIETHKYGLNGPAHGSELLNSSASVC